MVYLFVVFCTEDGGNGVTAGEGGVRYAERKTKPGKHAFIITFLLLFLCVFVSVCS
jgi:hypothetical protein